MRTIIKLSIMLFLGVFSALTLAGSVYNAQRPPRPMVQDMSGFYFGLGAGMSSVTANISSYYYEADDYHPYAMAVTTNTLFPAVQIGYWGHASSDIVWGLKAFYKYLNATGYYFNDIFTNHIAIDHEVALLFNVGFILRKVVPYFGVGAMWLPSIEDVYSNGLSQTRTRKSKVGAIAQLGFLYNLTSNWFVDMGYSFGFTGRSKYVGYPYGEADHLVTRKIRATTQEVMMSINRRF